MMKRLLGFFLMITIAVVAVVSVFDFTSLALGGESQNHHPNHQGSDRLGTLTAPSPNFEISLYPKPDPKLERLGYGLAGDRVTILQQMASNPKLSWYRVKFNNSPDVEGWIKGDYLIFINQENNSSLSIPNKNRYLGDRSPQVSNQGNNQGNQHQYNNYSQK